MPAGAPWPTYLKFTTAALLAMMAGSQTVHIYYKPLSDLGIYVERERKLLKQLKEQKEER